MTDVAWCQPDYEGKIHPRKFMVVYEDSEMGNAVFDNEDEAREHFEKASISWNCYLFGLMPRETIPVPRGGIETDWHAACVLLRRRFRKLEKAARAVVKATDEIHDNDPFPIKYRAPYGAITTGAWPHPVMGYWSSVRNGWLEYGSREEIDTGEVERLRAALEFYADELTWADTNPKDDDRLTVIVPSPSFAEIDRGNRARAALTLKDDPGNGGDAEPVAWIKEGFLEELHGEGSHSGIQTVLWLDEQNAGKRHSKRIPIYTSPPAADNFAIRAAALEEAAAYHDDLAAQYDAVEGTDEEARSYYTRERVKHERCAAAIRALSQHRKGSEVDG